MLKRFSLLRKRRSWLFAALILAAAFGLIAVAFEPNRIVPGLLHGDAFYQGRPTRYWREVLRTDGKAGQLSPQTIALFDYQWRAQDVLRECLKDPDRNVRWPAARFLGHSRLDSAKFVPELVTAVDDEDLEVRFKALWALAEIGPNAMAAGPRLAELIHDTDLQIALFADRALWRVDPRRAVKEWDWKPFSSEPWQFSAMFPAVPEEKISATLTPLGEVEIHSWTLMHGATALTVAVSEYSEEQVKQIPAEEWFSKLKESAGLFGLHMVYDKEIELSGIRGWEYLAEAELGQLWKRHYWHGRRLYQVQVAYKPEFVNLGAGRYFLESFRIEAPHK